MLGIGCIPVTPFLYVSSASSHQRLSNRKRSSAGTLVQSAAGRIIALHEDWPAPPPRLSSKRYKARSDPGLPSLYLSDQDAGVCNIGLQHDFPSTNRTLTHLPNPDRPIDKLESGGVDVIRLRRQHAGAVTDFWRLERSLCRRHRGAIPGAPGARRCKPSHLVASRLAGRDKIG